MTAFVYQNFDAKRCVNYMFTGIIHLACGAYLFLTTKVFVTSLDIKKKWQFNLVTVSPTLYLVCNYCLTENRTDDKSIETRGKKKKKFLTLLIK